MIVVVGIWHDDSNEEASVGALRKPEPYLRNKKVDVGPALQTRHIPKIMVLYGAPSPRRPEGPAFLTGSFLTTTGSPSPLPFVIRPGRVRIRFCQGSRWPAENGFLYHVGLIPTYYHSTRSQYIPRVMYIGIQRITHHRCCGSPMND